VTVGAVLRRERRERGLTQDGLGGRSGVSGSLVRGIEAEDRPLQPDLAARFARVLQAPEICFALCHECPANLLITLLDPNAVDLHPMAERANISEELGEALKANEALDLLNKRTLEGSDRAAAERLLGQMLDVVVAVLMDLSVMSSEFGFDPFAVLADHRRKLRMRGLLRDDDAARAAG